MFAALQLSPDAIDLVLRWQAGLFVSIVGGLCAAGGFVSFWQNAIKQAAKQRGEEFDPSEYFTDFPRRYGGIIERTIFTVWTAFGGVGVFPAMITWIIVKSLTNWQVWTKDRNTKTLRSLFAVGVYGSLISLFFAYLGGLVCRGILWP